MLNVSFSAGAVGSGSGTAEVVAYDAAGRRVRMLTSGVFTTGIHTTSWDGRDENGNDVTAGVYFLRSSSGGAQQTKKVVVIR